MSITMILNILTENRIMLIEAILGNILICIAVYTLFGKRKYVWFFPAACGVRYIFYNIGLLSIWNAMYGTQNWYKITMSTCASITAVGLVIFTAFLWKEPLAKVLTGVFAIECINDGILYQAMRMKLSLLQECLVVILIFSIIYIIVRPIIKKYRTYTIKHEVICLTIVFTYFIGGWMSNFLYNTSASLRQKPMYLLATSLCIGGGCALILAFVIHTRNIFRKKKELEQKEIKEGLIKASDMIDLIIEILRGSKSLKDAKNCLIHGETDNITFKTQKSKKEASKLCFTEKQASAILEMRLYRLIGLEIMALQEEYAEILKKIDKYQDILEHPASMKKVMKKDLEKIKKIYGFERKTELTNAKAAVVKALPIEEKEVVFVMDRFGYSKILDKSTYERNEETVLKEYRHIVHCMNTDKVCVFTDTGVMHQIKVQDIPSGRLRDKGTPLDNIGNYDSRNEQILLIAPDRTLKESSLLFVTAASMVKIVDGAEFIVQKKTVAATKLAEGDTLTAVRIVSAKESITNAQIIMQSEEGYFLRFPLEEVTRKKKGAIGIRGMKLQEQDHVKHIYLTGVEEEDTPSIIYKEKELVFSKIRLMGRDGKGVKVRR